MAFPNTPVLDAFTRSSLGGNWTGPLLDATILTSPNGTQLPGIGTGFTDAYWNADTVIPTKPIEAYATVVTKNPGGAETLMPYAVNVASKNGYAVEFDGTIAKVFKLTAGAEALIGTNIAMTLADGDVVGFQWLPGGTINVYQNGTLAGTRNDATFSTMDRIGLELGTSASIIVDNFGGGNKVTSLVQASPVAEDFIGTGNNATFSVPTIAGDLLMAFILTQNQLGDEDPTATLPAGWVLRDHFHVGDGSSDYVGEVWEYPNCPGGITSVFIAPGSGVGGAYTDSFFCIAEFDGLIPGPFDSKGSANGVAGTVATASPNPSAATDMAVMFACADDSNGVNPSLPVGWEDIGSNPNSLSSHGTFRAACRHGIGTGTLSISANQLATIFILSYKAGVEGAGPTPITANQSFLKFPKQLVRR